MADHNNPQSRDEEILIATIDRTEYNKLPQSRMEELLLELKETIEEGGGGTTNYNNLSNQPQVNGETLIGDKSGSDLGLVDAEEGKCLSTNDYDDKEKAAVAAATLAIAAMKDGSELDSFGDVEVALLDKADVSDLGTAAAKDSTNSVTSGSTDLVESGAVKDAIDAAVAAAYHHAGTKTVAQLTHDLLIAANEGNVYNITDSGTTTSDFIEGIGKTIDEGSNVGICKVGNVYMFDLLSGFVDTTNFVQKSQTAGLLNNDGTVNTTIEDDIDSLKSGFTNLDNEVNGDATVYPYADVITIEDAVPSNLAECSVKIEPVQDLHGFDHPWVGGAYKNKAYVNINSGETALTEIKDNDNNVIGVNADVDAAVGVVTVKMATVSIENGKTYTLSGSPNDKSNSTYRLDVRTQEQGQLYNNWNEIDNPTITATEDVTLDIYLRIAANYAVNNLVFHPQIEEGSTPTTYAPYTNICPITGSTEADVQRIGKNWFNMYSNLGSEYTKVATTTISGAFQLLTGRIHAGKWTFKNLSGTTAYIMYNNSDYSHPVAVGSSHTFTYDGYSYRSIQYSNISKTTTFKGQLEYGETATAYEPYQKHTYTIALGDTIYGGTVRIDSNGNTVMDVDRAVVDLGDFTWSTPAAKGAVSSTTSISGAINPQSNYDKANMNCSNYWVLPYYVDGVSGHDANSTDGAFAIWVTDGNKLFIRDLHLAGKTAEEAKTYLTGVQVLYELATPFTVQLTPQQIQLLKGTNTITASTGQISVTVNGVSGSIGAVQEQANDTDEALAELAADIAEQLPTAPTTDGAYVLTVTVADGTPTYSWESAS